jgi:hypothetical protein
MADKVGNGRESQTKLSLMKIAAENFIAEVASMNDSTGSLYRVAIVGFASES